MITIMMLNLLIGQCEADFSIHNEACRQVDAYVSQMMVEDMTPEEADNWSNQMILEDAVSIWRKMPY